MKYSVSLKSNRDFRRLYSRGKRAVCPTLVLYVQKNRQGRNRLGITVSKEEFLPGRDLVIVARVRGVHVSYWTLDRDLMKLARKLDLLRTEGQK